MHSECWTLDITRLVGVLVRWNMLDSKKILPVSIFVNPDSHKQITEWCAMNLLPSPFNNALLQKTGAALIKQIK